jgi:hypothetical protein
MKNHLGSHPRFNVHATSLNENLKPWEVRPRLEVEPFPTWYYSIFLNSCTLVILLQVDPTFGDELKVVYGGFCETEDTSIFA